MKKNERNIFVYIIKGFTFENLHHHKLLLDPRFTINITNEMFMLHLLLDSNNFCKHFSPT